MTFTEILSELLNKKRYTYDNYSWILFDSETDELIGTDPAGYRFPPERDWFTRDDWEEME